MSLNLSELYVEIIIGPMFSGKTSRLISECKKYRDKNIKTILISSKIDTRDDNSVITHDGNKFEAIKTNKLNSIIDNEEFQHAEVVCIDEAQFFDDLYNFILNIEHMKKLIIISGLDADSDRKKFGQIIDCIPLCNKIEKLEAQCMLSNNGAKASFSKRIVNKLDTIDVGGNDKYKAVCRNKFINNINF